MLHVITPPGEYRCVLYPVCFPGHVSDGHVFREAKLSLGTSTPSMNVHCDVHFCGLHPLASTIRLPVQMQVRAKRTVMQRKTIATTANPRRKRLTGGTIMLSTRREREKRRTNTRSTVMISTRSGKAMSRRTVAKMRSAIVTTKRTRTAVTARAARAARAARSPAKYEPCASSV